MSLGKSLPITKRMVWEAYQRVKRNGKAAGVDGQSLEAFAGDLGNNLYRLWNRLASGSYFPPPVRRVEIPKASGEGTRPLGIPTVADRIAQMVVKQVIEPEWEPLFDQDSYGYRPRKSALEAVARTRERCWKYAWVLDLDIRAFFDSMDHELLLRAVHKHTSERWVSRYIERWLKAPVQLPDGTIEARLAGTPQGGVISPLLANLYLHYTFDVWMRRNHSSVPFARYADDAVCHCHTQQQAEQLQAALAQRFADCGLQLHPDKTRVVYCRESRRRREYPCIQFTFLGYTFRPRMAKSRHGKVFTSFLPAASPAALQRMRAQIRSWKLHRCPTVTLEELSRRHNAVLSGWWQYYGRFYPTVLRDRLFRYFDERLGAWLRNKHKPLRRHRGRSLQVLADIARQRPHLFVHWQRLGHATVG
jgi:RNA-directed DNA polymerase